MKYVSRSSALVLVVFLVLGADASARLLPGAPRPAARVVDADGNILDLRTVTGKPMLILYEDKESATLNAAFKADLARLAKGDRYKNAVQLVPVADVERYDFWPARGFVKDAIRSESKKIGATIYCDWDGEFRRAASFSRATSSVMLIGKDARVLYSNEGLISPADRERIIGMLRAEVEIPAASR